jgi:hypothetical protein
VTDGQCDGLEVSWHRDDDGDRLLLAVDSGSLKLAALAPADLPRAAAERAVCDCAARLAQCDPGPGRVDDDTGQPPRPDRRAGSGSDGRSESGSDRRPESGSDPQSGSGSDPQSDPATDPQSDPATDPPSDSPADVSPNPQSGRRSGGQGPGGSTR